MKMSNDRIREKATSGFIWRFLERIFAQAVQLIVELVVARILLPEDFGDVALITVIISLLQVFIDSGLGNALIQKKDADSVDFSSVFYFNMVVCVSIYIMVYFLAPSISRFYDKPKLCLMIRVLSISLIISGLKNVQQAYVSKHLLFKKFFIATTGGTIVSAILGIGMAINGFGAWSIIAQNLSNTVIDTLILWITVKWRPSRDFEWNRLKRLLSFGWKLLVSSLLDTGYNSLRSLIIGKIYTSLDLAYYNRGYQFPHVIVTNISSSLNSVMLPILSDSQDEIDRVKRITKNTIQISAFAMWPLMIGLFCCADPLIRLILTEKWSSCIPYLRIFCIVYVFYPIHTANLNAINALGRSDIFLKLEIIKKTIGIITIIITSHISVKAIALGMIITTPLSLIVNSFPNRTMINYGILEQIKDIMPSVTSSIIMGVIIWPIQYLPINSLITVLIEVVIGSIVYTIISYKYQNVLYKFVKNTIISLLDNRFKNN